ncbi:hypothetical protein [Cellulomonas sp. HZM]|uniref:hypothetical protein n=1 Tax=Cellulomonas sp. HZM TaxID=1454010 RepID=UPI0006900974|nr:hypothetical protein [Cellulomonas sp. HZM]
MDARTLDIVPLTTTKALAQVHEEVLVPSFPAKEIEPLDELARELGRSVFGVAAVGDDGALHGAALAHWSARTGVLLLAHLAVAPGGRGGGVGGLLLEGALDRWCDELDPWLVLAEVEDPQRHGGGDPAHGDPAKRLRFYGKHGARRLPFPYFQPDVGGGRVDDVLLMALRVADDEREGDDWMLPAIPLHQFLVDQLTHAEGQVRDDAQTRALLEAAPSSGRVILHADGTSTIKVKKSKKDKKKRTE